VKERENNKQDTTSPNTNSHKVTYRKSHKHNLASNNHKTTCESREKHFTFSALHSLIRSATMLAAVVLALAGTALASPISSVSSRTTSQSEYYKLAISVTDPSCDFSDAPVNGLQLGAVHVGAGLNAPVPVAKGDGAVFFSTPEGTVQLATTGNPYGLHMSDGPEAGSESVFDFGINVGLGTGGFAVSETATPPALAAPKKGSFVICDQGFEAYAHPKRVCGRLGGDSHELHGGYAGVGLR
jgi:hypothetical protein